MLEASPRIWAQAIVLAVFLGAGASQPLTCPDECECYFDNQALFKVDCSNKDLASVPENIDEQTQILDLSNNQITLILPGTFSFLSELERLNLSGNHISSLSSYTFENLTSLTVLDLSNNLITEWEEIYANLILQPAKNLRKLILSKNPFRAIANLKPSQLLISESLHILELNDCGFTGIVGRSPIAGLKDLRQLNLAHNPIKRIHRLTSPTLRLLDLSNCELVYIAADELDFLPSLTHLHLSHNIRLSISEEGNSVRRLQSISLIHIDVSYCNMDHISLGGFPLLEVAKLRGNMLRKLNAGDFLNNSALRSLDLSSNSIEYVNKNAFDGLISLRTLNLSVNVIPSLHDITFTRLLNLTSLYVSRNYISTVGFLRSPSIMVLDMGYCEIQHLDKGSLDGLSSLEEINLSKNLISTLPNYLSSKTLKVLDLRYNRLSKLNNASFASLPSMMVLRLSENRFSDVWHRSYFDSNPNLEELTLHDNTWRCDCHDPEMKNFYEFVNEYPPIVWNINEVYCNSPSNSSGKTWWEACYFVWNPPHFLSVNQRALTYFLTVFIIFFIIGFVIMLIRRSNRARTLAHREQLEREQQEERDRMRELRMRREQEQQRNAPDPRDLISPPSYDEALLMPRLDGSYHSLAGMGLNQEKKKKKKLNRRTRSSGDLLEMDREDSEENRRRRRRSRRRSTASENARTEVGAREDRPDDDNPRNSEVEGILIHRLQESDF